MIELLSSQSEGSKQMTTPDLEAIARSLLIIADLVEQLGREVGTDNNPGWQHRCRDLRTNINLIGSQPNPP